MCQAMVRPDSSQRKRDNDHGQKKPTYSYWLHSLQLELHRSSLARTQRRNSLLFWTVIVWFLVKFS
ncbi:hypothetical protein JZ751_007187 [Albula glossodonta]|uniref:Uncharacterized protein n=1 Tax=Albula glossodonta TaxID=121402 RepID=A0A8T2P4V5_9TELE|nr:hypothetical protein JZ751_007187 [Albula glossodonta]